MISLDYPEWKCSHEYPDDWVFGGPLGGDPRADVRYRPNVYEFLDWKLQVIHTDCSPLCDHEAVSGKRMSVDRNFPTSKVYYIKVTRPDGSTGLIYSDIEGAIGVCAS